MIHVGVRNESMRDAQELARGQRRHVAEVEQQGAAAETEIDEQRGIRKGVVDEPRLHEPSHFLPPSRSIGATCRRRSAASRETKVPGRDLCTRYLTVENRGRNAATASRGSFVYSRRSRNCFRTPSHKRSGLRSPALASSMMRLAMISVARSPRSASPRATRAISNATPMTRLASRSNLVPSRNGVIGMSALVVQAGARPVSQPPAPIGAAAAGEEFLGAIRGGRLYACRLIAPRLRNPACSRNQRHGRSVCQAPTLRSMECLTER